MSEYNSEGHIDYKNIDIAENSPDLDMETSLRPRLHT